MGNMLFLEIIQIFISCKVECGGKVTHPCDTIWVDEVLIVS